MVLELAILAEAPAGVFIHRLTTGMHEAREEMGKVQLELNLQIVEMRLKAQPSTPVEAREQCTNAITSGMDGINSVVSDCTKMLED